MIVNYLSKLRESDIFVLKMLQRIFLCNLIISQVFYIMLRHTNAAVLAHVKYHRGTYYGTLQVI